MSLLRVEDAINGGRLPSHWRAPFPCSLQVTLAQHNRPQIHRSVRLQDGQRRSEREQTSFIVSTAKFLQVPPLARESFAALSRAIYRHLEEPRNLCWRIYLVSQPA